MKLRTVLGFGIGYFLGAKSQSEGGDPQEVIKSVVESDAFKSVLHQARQLAASGMEAITGQEPSWAPQDGESGGSGGGGSSQGASGESGSSQEDSGQSSSEESESQSS